MDVPSANIFSVSLKLTNLHDYYQKLLHGNQPVPSGLDMANTLKFFSQMLLCKYLSTILSTLVSNILSIYTWSRSSVERGSRIASRNGKIWKVRRGTHGTLPEFGLQTAVQRPHSADRRCLLHSHRSTRFVLYFYFNASIIEQNLKMENHLSKTVVE